MSGRRILLVCALTVVAAAGLAVPATADPHTNDWARLRQCESGGRYDIVSANGRYYGAYQFDLGTWRSVGGAGLPHQASPAEQDFRALYLYRMRGWQPWTCARTLGLREDGDARSKRVPTYAEAAYIGGGAAATPTSSSDMPPWPGRTFQYGDCDPALRTFQLRMNVYGYDFQGTGCYRDETRVAVLALQRANGIKDSGILGPKTWTAAWQGKPPTG
jgi:resuscitation-promoting factor RpfA